MDKLILFQSEFLFLKYVLYEHIILTKTVALNYMVEEFQ
jgi:hypothetical protein